MCSNSLSSLFEESAASLQMCQVMLRCSSLFEDLSIIVLSFQFRLINGTEKLGQLLIGGLEMDLVGPIKKVDTSDLTGSRQKIKNLDRCKSGFSS